MKIICYNPYTGCLQVHELSNVFKLYNVATILWLDIIVQAMLFPLISALYFCISTFRSMCMPVVCSSLILFFQICYSSVFWMDFTWFQLPLWTSGITFFLIFNIRFTSILMSSYFHIFSASFLIIFLSPRMQRLLTNLFLMSHYGFWCLLHCKGWWSFFLLGSIYYYYYYSVAVVICHRGVCRLGLDPNFCRNLLQAASTKLGLTSCVGEERKRPEKSALAQGGLQYYILCAGGNRILSSCSAPFNDM